MPELQEAKQRTPWHARVHRFFKHASVNITVGIAVVVCAIAEIVGELEDASDVKAAHGMLLLGVVHALRAFGELGEGAHKVVAPAEESG